MKGKSGYFDYCDCCEKPIRAGEGYMGSGYIVCDICGAMLGCCNYTLPFISDYEIVNRIENIRKTMEKQNRKPTDYPTKEDEE